MAAAHCPIWCVTVRYKLFDFGSHNYGELSGPFVAHERGQFESHRIMKLIQPLVIRIKHHNMGSHSFCLSARFSPLFNKTRINSDSFGAKCVAMVTDRDHILGRPKCCVRLTSNTILSYDLLSKHVFVWRWCDAAVASASHESLFVFRELDTQSHTMANYRRLFYWVAACRTFLRWSEIITIKITAIASRLWADKVSFQCDMGMCNKLLVHH